MITFIRSPGMYRQVNLVVKVGYMGIPLSNSDAMSREFCRDNGIGDAEFVPLVSAKDTVDALLKGEIDYGVLAVENRFAGTVIETRDALKGHDEITEVDTKWTHIHHCVFKKSPDCQVRKLVSHIQALLQSQNNLKRIYPDAEFVECEDTAYAAEMLADGTLSDDCAAVCRRDAGEFYNLFLDSENVEDNKENMTRFLFVRL